MQQSDKTLLNVILSHRLSTKICGQFQITLTRIRSMYWPFRLNQCILYAELTDLTDFCGLALKDIN